MTATQPEPSVVVPAVYPCWAAYEDRNVPIIAWKIPPGGETPIAITADGYVHQDTTIDWKSPYA